MGLDGITKRELVDLEPMYFSSYEKSLNPVKVAMACSLQWYGRDYCEARVYPVMELLIDFFSDFPEECFPHTMYAMTASILQHSYEKKSIGARALSRMAVKNVRLFSRDIVKLTIPALRGDRAMFGSYVAQSLEHVQRLSQAPFSSKLVSVANRLAEFNQVMRNYDEDYLIATYPYTYIMQENSILNKLQDSVDLVSCFRIQP